MKRKKEIVGRSVQRNKGKWAKKSPNRKREEKGVEV